MPIAEADVGITEILGLHRPFRAVIKQSIDDFVVNEVLLSGQIAQLTKLAQFPARKENKPRKRPHEQQDGKVNVHIDSIHSITDISFEQLETCFDSEQTKGFVTDSIRKYMKDKGTELVLPTCNDKKKRTAIHAWVRNNLSGHVTDTIEIETAGENAQAVRLRPKSACRPWKRRKAPGSVEQRVEGGGRKAPADAAKPATYDPREDNVTRDGRREVGTDVARDAIVSFVLWKRNKDTMEAINALSRALRIPASAFSYAGTKDKRAVTTQLVTIRGVQEARLANANAALARGNRKFRNIAVGNFQILSKDAPRSLSLGDLLGNRFTLALRDLDLQHQADEENIKHAVEGTRVHGFVNYFGLQRFGTGVSGTHETGFAVLRGDFEDACRRILLPVSVGDSSVEGGDVILPERKQLIEALQKFAKKELNAQSLLNSLPPWMHIERTLVMSFARDEQRGIEKYDYKAAFGKLPRNLRRMYGHAVQSYLWNIMASERIRMHRPDDPSRMHGIKGDLIVVNLDDKQEMNYETEVRTVTEQEEQDRSISVFRVVIPVIGSEVSVPEGVAYGSIATKIITEQKIELSGNLVREFGMKGTYRLLLAVPRDLEMEIVSYTDSREVLIPGAILPSQKPEKQSEQQEQSGHKLENDLTATDPQSENKKCMDSAENGTASVLKVKDDPNDEPMIEPNPLGNGTKVVPISKSTEGDVVDTKKALVIGFTLGRGQFATMLVRELTRKDSSTANQKAMQENRRDIIGEVK